MGTSSGRAYQQGVIDNLIILRDGGARLPAERHRQHCGDLVDPSGRAGSGSATMIRGHYHLIIASTATTRPMESLTAHHREDHRHAPSPRIPDKPQPYNLPRHALPLVVRHPPPSLGCVSTTYPRPSEPEHLRFHNRGSHLTPLPVSGVWSSPGSPAPRDLTIGTHPHRAFQISHSHTTCLAMPCPWLCAIPFSWLCFHDVSTA